MNLEAKLNILVVEDSFLIATRLKNILEEIANVKTILLAPTIYDAQQTLQNRPIEVIVLDIHLPDGNGLHLLTWLKEKYAGLYVIIFSNHSGVAERAYAKKAGADHFLDKSLDFDKVKPIIESISLLPSPEPGDYWE